MKKNINYRGEKLGWEIKRIISELLARELKDPVFDRIISISHVKSTADGSFATVYFTSLGGDEATVEAGFENAKGFIRNEIGRRLGIRRSPELRFKPDAIEHHGRRIDMLLGELDLPAGQDRAGREVQFSEIPGIVNAYEKYLIFPHIHLDGDTLGSAAAFADAMLEIGREARVVIGEELPRSLKLIDAPFIVNTEEAERVVLRWNEGGEISPYLAIVMDFSGFEQLKGREELFENAAETLCIDHHVTSKPTCDYNYFEPGAAATAEIVYRLLKQENLPVTERIATALYIGIVTDTGRFQYMNTLPETHRITACLLEAGADFSAAYSDIYQNIKAEKLYVQSAMLNTLDIFADDKAALAFIENDTLERLDASEDETDGMSELLRSIIGIEVSVFLRELADGRIKASMRTKEWVDAAALAAEFGGGGHVRAAGFTTDLPMEQICETLKEKITAAIRSVS